MNGRISKSKVEIPHQRLSKAQEDDIVKFILRQESLGYPPTHSQVRHIASTLLAQNGGDTTPLGQN